MCYVLINTKEADLSRYSEAPIIVPHTIVALMIINVNVAEWTLSEDIISS